MEYSFTTLVWFSANSLAVPSQQSARFFKFAPIAFGWPSGDSRRQTHGRKVSLSSSYGKLSRSTHCPLLNSSILVTGWTSHRVDLYLPRCARCSGSSRVQPLIRTIACELTQGARFAVVHFGWALRTRGVVSTTTAVSSPSPGCSAKGICQSTSSGFTKGQFVD